MGDDVLWNGAVDVRCEGWVVTKTFVFRSLTQSDRVSLKLIEAAEEYLRLFKDYPRLAYVSKLPRGVENGVEVDGVMLFESEWMPPACVAVGWIDL